MPVTRQKYPEAQHFHCASHKLNVHVCVGKSCPLRSVLVFNYMYEHCCLLQLQMYMYIRTYVFFKEAEVTRGSHCADALKTNCFPCVGLVG